MTMMGNLYCALVELGGGFDCQQNDDGVITYVQKATGKTVTISNAKGRFSRRGWPIPYFFGSWSGAPRKQASRSRRLSA